MIVATRWHPQDLIGCLLRDAEQSGENWRVVSFPAIGGDGAALWPERWPLEKLERIRAGYNASGYPWQWEALYQQTPPEILDSEFPAEYFSDAIWFDDWPADSETSLRVMALDPSLGKTDKADYSAFIMLAKGHDHCYYIDADLARRPSSRMVSDGVELFRAFQPLAFGSETNQFQQLLKEQFDQEIAEQNLPVRCFAIHNHEPKPTRIRSLTPLLAQGRIKLRRGSPGVNLLLEQLKGFPSHKYDDGPDGLEMAIRLCDSLLSGEVGGEPPAEMIYTT